MRDQRTILITGATDGLGRRTAEMLAAPGVSLLVHGRDAARGRAVVEAVEAAGGSATFFQADFASLAAVRALGETIAAAHSQLDVVVNNAGVAVSGSKRRLSEDGHELHFAVNYLAAFLLTHTLRASLGKLRPSLVINVASAGQSEIDFENVMLERGYDGMRAYTQSKLADVMLAIDLSQAWGSSNVSSTSLHPGTYLDTGMIRANGIAPLNPVDVGARAILALIAKRPEAVSGRYFDVMREARAIGQAYDVEARRRLREISVAITGTPE